MASGLACKWMRLSDSTNFYRLTRFSANLRAQKIETTNAESVGSFPIGSGSGSVAEEFIYGVAGGDVEAEIIYQETDNLYLKLAPGSTPTILFYPKKILTSISLTGVWFIETWKIVAEIKDGFKVQVAGPFTGGYGVNSTF